MQPLVDIIIPMHDSAGTIGAAIASLRAQTERAWRAIVVDDGSSDEGPGIVRAAAGQDGRIELHSQANAGVAAARNAGLERATAPFVMFLDADDWLLPRALERLLPHAGADCGSPRGAFGGFEFHDAGGRFLAEERSQFAEIGLNELLGLVFLVVHGHLVPRCAIGRERFDPTLSVVEDTDLWLRLAARGLRWANCGGLVGAYRVRPSSRSFDFGAMVRASAAAYARAFSLPTGLEVDRSAARLARVHCSAAWAYATRAALCGDEAGGEALFQDAAGDKSLTSAQLAIMAWQGVIMGLAVSPGDAGARRVWQPRLDAWWRRATERGWAGAETVEKARAQLEGRIGSLHHPGRARVSVVVPLFQSGETVERAIASISTAGENEFEAVVVNDGSTDAGPALAQDAAERDRRVRVVHQLNRGLAAARNTGIEAGGGAFVHFLDADDELAPGGLRLLLNAAESAGAPGACGPFEVRSAAGERIDEHQPPPGPLNHEAFLEGRFVVCHSLLIRREALGGHRFDESWGRIEDYHLWLRLAAAGVWWARTAGTAPVCVYHLHPVSMSTRHGDMAAQARRLYGQPFALIEGRPSARLQRDSALSWATRAALCAGADGGTDEAVAILAALPQGQAVTPFAAAQAAVSAVTLGLAIPCRIDGRSERSWAPTLGRFWRACEDGGIAASGFARAAARALALRATSDDAVARAVLERCDPARPLVIIGLGRNGRRLASIAATRGLRIAARDDAARDERGIDGLAMERMDAPISAGATVVISPSDDGALWPRFASPGRQIIRWSAVAAKMAEASVAHLFGAMGLGETAQRSAATTEAC